MKLLLDTCSWLWWYAEPERLGARQRALIADPEVEVVVSAVSAWEIAIKYARGRLPLPEPPDVYVTSRIAADGMTPLPIVQAHALRVASLPPHHADPFDRLLIAQAQVERLPIVTGDPLFRRYDVEVIDA